MIRARLSPKAGRDLDEVSYHIAAENPQAAERYSAFNAKTPSRQDAK